MEEEYIEYIFVVIKNMFNPTVIQRLFLLFVTLSHNCYGAD